MFGGSELSCWEWVSGSIPYHSGTQCGPKAVIRAATCMFRVPDLSEALFVALSSLSLGSEAFLFTYALRFWGGFLFHTILLPHIMCFSSFVTVSNYWQQLSKASRSQD